MVKRVYPESVKKWLIASGITTSSLIMGIFIYLSMIGAITPTGSSGDMVCGGYDNECYALMNFTANEDIFLYPIGYDPWGRDTPFVFTDGVLEWKLQRSWGDSWRDIPLDDTCKGTWCGGKYGVTDNAYSYAFRKGRNYEIRVVAIINPFMDVKWSAFDDEFDPWWNSSWGKCQNVTITNIGSTTLTDFPIPINITYDSSMQVDFDDIRFTDEPCGVGGNLLTAELETKTNSVNAYTWVKHTLVAAGDVIGMHYDNAAASSNWDSSGGVWDANDAVVSLLTDATDSTSNANDGTGIGASAVTGRYGGGADFDGVLELINISDANSLDFSTQFTFNFWGRQSTYNTDGGTIFKYRSANGFRSYQLRTTNTNEWQLTLSATGNAGVSDSSGQDCAFTANDVWTHFSIVYNAGDIFYYKNGALCDTDTTTVLSIFNGATPLYYGRGENSGQQFNGTLDGIMLSDTNRTADWINETYQLIANAASFITFSAEESRSVIIYYVSNSGSDSNSGNITNPFKTITKVNTLGLSAGDSVLFNRSNVWRSMEDAYLTVTSGDATSDITYGAFGTGARPLILGSINMNNAANWTDLGGNIWRTVSTSSTEIGNIIFNNGTDNGIRKDSYGDVNSDLEWWYNTTNDKTSVYTTVNPGTRFTDVELAVETNIISFSDLSHITFQELDTRYGARHGFGGSRTHNITIWNNTIEWIGGGYQTGTTRFGNGIEFFSSSQDNIAAYNNITQAFDAGITVQSSSSAGVQTIRNIHFHHNIIPLCYYGAEYFNSDANSKTDNVTIDQNTIVSSGEGFGGAEDGRLFSRSFLFNSNPVNSTGIVVKNNIAYNSTSYREIDLGKGSSNWKGAAPTFNYNLYFSNTSNPMFFWNGTNYQTLALFQAGEGQEANGKETNPEFTDVANGDYIPVWNSPACLMSDTGSYVGALPCANPVNSSITNFTVNYKTTDSNVELGTSLPVNATAFNSIVCIDVNQQDYGTNFTCATNITSFSLLISNFRNKLFNDSTTAKNVTFTTGTLENQSVYFSVHQHDEVDSLVINITGFTAGGSKPSDVKIYINGELSNTLGDIFANTFTKFNGDESKVNVTFTGASTDSTTVIKAYDGTTVTTALMNITGHNYTSRQLLADSTSSDGTFIDVAANANDGDLDTYATTDVDANSTIYWNWTKPTGALSASTWAVKDFNDSVNITLPATCFAQSTIQTRVNLDSDSGAVFTAFAPANNNGNSAWTLQDSDIQIGNFGVTGCTGGNYITPGYTHLKGKYAINRLKAYTTVPIDVSSYSSGDVSFKMAKNNRDVADDWFQVVFKAGGSTCDGVQYGQDADQCRWYSHSFNIVDECGYMPEELTIEVEYLMTHSTSLLFHVKDVYVSTTPQTNVTWECYNGTEWLDVREREYDGASASTFAKVYENSIYWTSYPNTVWMEVGDINGTRDWNFSGEFSAVDNQSNDFTGKMNNYLSTCAFDDAGVCDIPIYLHSDSIGILELSDLNVAYDFDVNPLSLDGTLVQANASNGVGFVDVEVVFESSSNGTIQIDDVKLDYAGGNKSYKVTAHDPSYTYNKTINLTYYHSGWNYNFPLYIDYLEFIPRTPTTKNVTPYGQTTTKPMLNISMYNYGGKNMNFSIYLNETFSCINVTLATSNDKSTGTQLTNGSWIDYMNDRSYLNYTGLWMWADYQCNFTSWYLWEPLYSFRGCCIDCICSEDRI